VQDEICAALERRMLSCGLGVYGFDESRLQPQVCAGIKVFFTEPKEFYELGNAAASLGVSIPTLMTHLDEVELIAINGPETPMERMRVRWRQLATFVLTHFRAAEIEDSLARTSLDACRMHIAHGSLRFGSRST
jgi:hypothetical protein